ncbi:MAG: PTS sugar transporter subunit IIA [Tetragenococcus halophilus]|uniref:Galactitol-specific phosphotransferase system enzyme IIA component n=3 Tax=Tetragenococcus halophilus TaxID=51669 RepID=A0AAN1VQ83_TETHN|nr:PTS sugar transporter subunit IIA [Tetragenococcus halophilus]MDN6182103.1 PTS sugar transporter subunit IIA [Staphylococcus equorum]MDN6184749.1 PTS sugar transporter subunit IIA [Lactococcus lactis]MCF1676581.1 PTS sugar transporter subunit IIA [Tetragenococcus halophilus]MCO7027342.1 PTS sugar transporter subunit IIA [Tetragenococcus halophilus]MCO8299066.1 PTS sugar transporter subunit IIA [Tetragenococcus halophilus]
MENNENSQLALSEHLILLNLEAKNQEDALSKMAENLASFGFVKSTYKRAIIEREKTFPTGLQGSEIGIAIPHTDAKHVNQQSVSVAVLNQPVEFIHMGSENQMVSTKIIFMLAIDKPDSQLEMLQKLISLIQKEEVLQKIIKSKSCKEVLKLLYEELL